MDIQHNTFANNTGTRYGHNKIQDSPDVTIDGTLQDKDVLQWNNTNQTFDNVTPAAIAGTIALDDLSTVDTTGAVDGSLLRNNGTNWIVNSGTQVAGLMKIEELSNATTVNATPSNSEVIYADGGNWTSALLSTVTNDNVNAADIADIDDATNPLDGHVLIGNSTHFINSLISDETKTRVNLTDIKDCNITGAVNGEILTYNSGAGEWENQAAAGGGGGRIYNWGAVMSTPNCFPTSNGTNLNAQILGGSPDHRCEVTVTSAGTLNILSWNSSTADATTEIEIYKNGSSVSTHTLSGAVGVVTGIGESVAQGDEITLFWNGTGAAPGNSVWHVEVN